jgi:hypothetical protein
MMHHGYAQECLAPVVPQTEVGFVSRNASCSGNTVETSLTHALQLGIYCKDPTQGSEEFVFYQDLFIDCLDETADFGFMDVNGVSDGSTEVYRYTCSKSVTFPAGSTSGQVQTIPFVGIATDLYWSTNPDPDCYQNGTMTAPTASTPTAPVPLPTLAPTPPDITVTLSPLTPVPAAVLPPSLAPVPTTPSGLLTSSPALVPASVPVALPTARDVSPSSDSGFPVGAAVGATAGVLVVAGVVAFLVLRQKSKGSSTDNAAGDKPPVTVNPAPPAHGGATTGHDYAETEGDVGHHSGASGTSYNSNSATNTFRQEETEVDLGHQQPPMPVYGAPPAQMYQQPQPPPPPQQQYPPSQQYLQPQPHAYVPQPVQPLQTHPYAATPQPMAHPYTQQHGEEEQYVGSGTSAHSAPHASSTRGHTASSQTTATHQHKGQAVQPNTRPVEFKDQARSVVYDVPMTDVQPIMAEAVATPYHPPSPNQQHVMDSSLVSSGTTATGRSNRSDPDGRRQLDP